MNNHSNNQVITQRSQIPYELKLEILDYYLLNGRKAMRAKYNMTNQAAGHLIYHDKQIIEAIEDQHFERVGL